MSGNKITVAAGKVEGDIHVLIVGFTDDEDTPDKLVRVAWTVDPATGVGGAVPNAIWLRILDDD